MTTLQEPPALDASPTASAVRESTYRRLFRELLSFGLVGGIGTVITFVGANLGRHWMSDSPLTTVVVPMMIATLVSYLLNRAWTFRDRGSDGSSREVLLFFALNGIGVVIQLICMGVRSYTLHLNGAVSYNVALVIGTMLGTAFRYWSYKRWVFLPVSA